MTARDIAGASILGAVPAHRSTDATLPSKAATAENAKNHGVASVTFARDGRLLLGTTTADILVWTPRSTPGIRRLSVPPLPDLQRPIAQVRRFDPRTITQIAFSPSGMRFAALVFGGAVIIGSWGDSPRVDTVVPTPENTITTAFADENKLLIGTEDTLVRIDLANNYDVRIIKTIQQVVEQLATDPDRNRDLLATAGDAFQLWDGSTGALLGPSSMDSGGAVAFSSDASAIFLSARQGSILEIDADLHSLVERACQLVDPSLAYTLEHIGIPQSYTTICDRFSDAGRITPSPNK